MHVTGPVRKRTVSTGSDTILLPQQGEDKIPPGPGTAQPMGNCYNIANEKSLCFKLSVSSNRFFAHSISSQVRKRTLLSFVLRTGVWFALDGMSQVAILCCSQIKPFFLEKYLTVYLLKVNTCVWWKRTSGGYILFLAVH